MIRKPAVEGQFYTSDKSKLSKMVGTFIESADVPANAVDAVSYVAPHAGYRYSGQTAGYTYKALSMKRNLKEMDTFILIGPNHTGLGYPLSISDSDWETKLGLVENDIQLTREIAAHSDGITIDNEAHRQEHSIEVQLPFLQKVVDKPRGCFICMGDQSFDSSALLAEAIEKAASRLKRRITVIASSDFNHYESAAIAKKKDLTSIGFLKGIDYEGFNGSIKKLDDSACGFGPITVSAIFGKDSGAKAGELLKYTNSADATKDYDSVVAYASIIFG